jgi:hypothetical protein
MAFSISASPLSCECGAVTISGAEIPDSPSRWGVFLFYKAVLDATPYYSHALCGNLDNPVSDTKWDVKLPMNAEYSFTSIALAPFDLDTEFGVTDWTFNPVDGWIYISLDNTNSGHPLDDQVYWRRFDENDLQYVSIKYVNAAAGTLERATIDQNVTCNDSYLGMVPKMCYSDLSSVPTLVIEDKTKKFSFDCNPNGYGGANPFRDEYAFMSILTNTKSDGTFSEYQARAYSYRSGLKYYYDIPRDGLYVQWVFMVPFVASESSWNMDYIVFEETSNKFYKSLIDNNTEAVTNDLAWGVITSYEEFSTGYLYKTQAYYYVFANNGRKILYDLMQGIEKSCPCNCSAASKCGSDLWKKYLHVFMAINSACENLQLGRYSQAQCDLEKIPKNCAPYISAFKC